MLEIVIAVSLVIIAAFCVMITLIGWSMISNAPRPPTIGDVVDREDAFYQRLTRELEPIISRAVREAVSKRLSP